MTTDTAAQPDAGPMAEDLGFEDYWGVQETLRYTLPDGKQYFEIRPMDEGAKTRFQKLTNKGLRMNQRSNEAIVDIDPADERHTLIKESVVGWLIMQRGPDGDWSELPCPTDEPRRKRVLEQEILQKFNPKVIQDLEFFIRTSNPWMQADMDVEEIDKELERLQTLRKQALEAEVGEGASASK